MAAKRQINGETKLLLKAVNEDGSQHTVYLFDAKWLSNEPKMATKQGIHGKQKTNWSLLELSPKLLPNALIQFMSME